jgi:hypothetical protein
MFTVVNLSILYSEPMTITVPVLSGLFGLSRLMPDVMGLVTVAVRVRFLVRVYNHL